MNAAQIKSLFNSGVLTVDFDDESGYYGETTTTTTVKYNGEIVHTEKHSTYSDYCSCNN